MLKPYYIKIIDVRGSFDDLNSLYNTEHFKITYALPHKSGTKIKYLEPLKREETFLSFNCMEELNYFNWFILNTKRVNCIVIRLVYYGSMPLNYNYRKILLLNSNLLSRLDNFSIKTIYNHLTAEQQKEHFFNRL